ncbi:MAG: GNAT family N-acetyltransferase [Verrucomicrobiota bacterium]
MTPHVSLRQVEPADLPILFAHQADAEAARLAAFATRDHDAFMAHWQKIMANPQLDARTILADGAVAGNIGSWSSGSDRMVGYWIGREYWGRGVATAALTQFLREVPHRPLVARVAKHNPGSIRVLQKCGFRVIGEETSPGPDGQPVGEFVFSLSDPPPAYTSPACSMPEIRD